MSIEIVDVTGDALHIVGVLVAPRRRHLKQHGELARYHQVAGRGSRQHKPPAPLALLKCELLRQSKMLQPDKQDQAGGGRHAFRGRAHQQAGLEKDGKIKIVGSMYRLAGGRVAFFT